MSSAFKVGLITILTIVTILVGVIYIWQINPGANYQLSGYFPHVGGIKTGSPVTLMGVKIGEVVDVTPQPVEKRVRLVMNIDKKFQLPVGSSFTIVTTGLVGDKTLEVLPPPNPTNVFLKPGDQVQGIPPASLDAIFVEAEKMMKSARALVDDQGLRSDIKRTVHSVSLATDQMNSLFRDLKGVTKGFGRLTDQTEHLLSQINGATAETIPDIRAIVGSVRRISNNLENVSGQVNTLVHDQGIYSDTKNTMHNISELTRQWNDLTGDLRHLAGQSGDVVKNVGDITNDIREITSDPEVKANVKSVAKNASQLSNAILSLTSATNQSNEHPWQVDLRTEALGVARVDSEFKVVPGAEINFNLFGKLGFDFPLSYFRVGLDEIGDTNLVNLQAGSDIADGLGILRFGLVRGRIGAGTDLHLNFMEQPLTVTGELYDINSPRMRLGLLQNVFGDFGISAYWDNQFFKGINEFNVGVRWEPGTKPAPPGPTPAPGTMLPRKP